VTYRRVLDWMIRVIDTLYTPIRTTINYSATPNRCTLQFTAANTIVLSLLQSPLPVSGQRILIHSKYFCKVFTFNCRTFNSQLISLDSIICQLLAPELNSTQFFAATANSGTELNSNSSSLRSSSYSLGADPQRIPLTTPIVA
jgi:hypothetical protein